MKLLISVALAAVAIGLGLAGHANAGCCCPGAHHRAVYHHVHAHSHHYCTAVYRPPPPEPYYYHETSYPEPGAEPGSEARIYFHGNSVAFIAGLSGGHGTLVYRGRRVPLDVSGFSIGEIGVHHYDFAGDVYGLHDLGDIEGTYAAGHASATVGAGGGGIAMHNGRGVIIRAHSTSEGLAFALGPKGVNIRIER